MQFLPVLIGILLQIQLGICRDEEKIVKACYWPNEVYEPCFAGCAEVSCDNPRNHLRPCYPYCEPGCVCEDPYVRDDRTHQCVLPQDCSQTQMGIPVPTKKSEKSMAAPPMDASKYASRRSSKSHTRRDDLPMDFQESDVPPNTNNINPMNSNVNQKDDLKRGSDMSRMGNYFNIVIAPPPIKALQPRKLLQNEAYRTASKHNM